MQDNYEWHVLYRTGDKYSLYHNDYKKTWHEAKQFCEERKSILATVQSRGDLDEARGGVQLGGTWIGGSDIQFEDVWTWLDGTPWPTITCKKLKENGDWFRPCLNWADFQPGGGQRKNCLFVEAFTWVSGDCSADKDFICETKVTKMTSNRNFTLKLDKHQSASKVEVWLKRKPGK